MRLTPIVLDSWAVIALLENEPCAPEVERILIEALHARTPILMSCVNLGEVWCCVARAHDTHKANLAIERLQDLGVHVEDADWGLTRQAAEYKARGKLAYADCFAAALARAHNAELVTGDKELAQLEGEIRIAWL